MPSIEDSYTILFIHGYTASSKADWYPAISEELKKLNVNFAIPDLPGGAFPQAEEWVKTIHETVQNIHTPLVFVGHSLGTRAVLLYLEKYHPIVEKVFLVAAFQNDTIEHVKPEREKEYGTFFVHKIDTSKIMPHVGKFVLLHSTDDPDISFGQGVEIAHELGAAMLTYVGLEHFSDPRCAPVIKDVLQKELVF